MRQVAGETCADGVTCEGIFEDGDTVVFRGPSVDQATLERGAHEAVVRLPKALLDEYLERR
jgi:hypothetical protein